MKYNNKTKQAIETMHLQKFSSRDIATKLAISKSGVNYFLQRNDSATNAGPRILFLDLETSAALAYLFGRFKVNIGQANIKEEGGKLLVAGFAINDNPVSALYVDSKAVNDDKHICEALHQLFEHVDIVVAHNGRNFDIKMLNARLVFNGFPPLSGVKVIDTLEMAKSKFRFPSNRLDSLGEYLGVGRKIDTGGIELWKKVQENDAEALTDMVNYCIQDVELLRLVFYKLMSYGGSASVNWALYYDDNKPRCIYCGSEDVAPTGKFVYAAVSKFNEYRCGCCSATMRDRSNKNSKQKAQSLFTRII